MKVRQGFVSNSSSSSFIVAFKKDIKSQDWGNLLGINKTSPFYGAFVEQVASLFEDAENKFENYEQFEEWKKDEYGDEENIFPEVKEFFDKGMKEVWIGDFCSDGNSPVEAMLAETDLNYEDDNFAIVHHGGY
jgi:hypothetical protein